MFQDLRGLLVLELGSCLPLVLVPLLGIGTFLCPSSDGFALDLCGVEVFETSRDGTLPLGESPISTVG